MQNWCYIEILDITSQNSIKLKKYWVYLLHIGTGQGKHIVSSEITEELFLEKYFQSY